MNQPYGFPNRDALPGLAKPRSRFSSTLRRLLFQQNLTVAAGAERYGVPVDTLTKWVHGTSPKVSTLQGYPLLWIELQRVWGKEVAERAEARPREETGT